MLADKHTTHEDCCPKRGWLLSVLGDEEASGNGERLPRWVAFHLTRCPECRELAERLRGTVERMGELGRMEPSAELLDGARRRILEIAGQLPASARTSMTGDQPEPIELLDRKWYDWRTWNRYTAIAAVVLVAVSCFLVGRYLGTNAAQVTQHGVHEGPLVAVSPLPEPAPAVEATQVAGTVPSLEQTESGAPSVFVAKDIYEAAEKDTGDAFQRATVIGNRAADRQEGKVIDK